MVKTLITPDASRAGIFAKKMTHTHQAGGKIALGFHKVCKSCDIDILTPAIGYAHMCLPHSADRAAKEDFSVLAVGSTDRQYTKSLLWESSERSSIPVHRPGNNYSKLFFEDKILPSHPAKEQIMTKKSSFGSFSHRYYRSAHSIDSVAGQGNNPSVVSEPKWDSRKLLRW